MHALLARHPQVTMASVKETCFFNDHHARGTDWYHELFPTPPWRQAVGEVSNTYLFSPEAALRARDYNPGMRGDARERLDNLLPERLLGHENARCIFIEEWYLGMSWARFPHVLPASTPLSFRTLRSAP